MQITLFNFSCRQRWLLRWGHRIICRLKSFLILWSQDRNDPRSPDNSLGRPIGTIKQGKTNGSQLTNLWALPWTKDFPTQLNLLLESWFNDRRIQCFKDKCSSFVYDFRIQNIRNSDIRIFTSRWIAKLRWYKNTENMISMLP